MLELQDIKPQPPIIVKRITIAAAGHHGGAWKVAYADFVTAMMAFFLIMWILGATTEDQRRGIADYFRPTLAQQSRGGGANGLLGGRSLQEKDGIAVSAEGAMMSLDRPISKIDRSLGNGGEAERSRDVEAFETFRRELVSIIDSDAELSKYANQFQLALTAEGLRLEVTDAPGSSLFGVGEARASDFAASVLAAVAAALRSVDNEVAIRGHTDGRVYARPRQMNNWLLSAARADVTRRLLERGGVASEQLVRIEGTADRELRNRADPLDERNRRISITLLFSEPGDRPQKGLFRQDPS